MVLGNCPIFCHKEPLMLAPIPGFTFSFRGEVSTMTISIGKMMTGALVGAIGMTAMGSAHAADTLRLLTWADYAPKDVIDAFTKETGITVEVTLSNNEEMIS